jgi:hypothetical protein
MDISPKFSPGYVGQIFALWYDSGKASIQRIYRSIPEDNLGNKPTLATVRDWTKHEKWIERADWLDEESDARWAEKQIESRVEMLDRHAKIGKEMQEMSLEWLRENKEDLSPGTAVRMLVDGVEMERGIAGIPDALRKMQEMQDEDLTEEIAKLISDSKIEDANI